MDRRQQKTRQAVFQAFSRLIAQKNYNKITVQEIIDAANVGRTTFYTHFETKYDLLKDFCDEFFRHIIDAALDCSNAHHIQGCYSYQLPPQSVFLHLLQHLQVNDDHILELLACESNDLFLRCFKNSLNDLVRIQFAAQIQQYSRSLPEDFLVNHISASFVEMVLWWLTHQRRETPEVLNEYFQRLMFPILGTGAGLSGPDV